MVVKVVNKQTVNRTIKNFHSLARATYATMSGKYLPLSTWRKDKKGNLVGKLTMPMAVGTIGGAISIHPIANIALKILRVESATELGEVAASAGLAYNLAALHTLITTGIRAI